MAQGEFFKMETVIGNTSEKICGKVQSLVEEITALLKAGA
jgi:hypothetical protein